MYRYVAGMLACCVGLSAAEAQVSDAAPAVVLRADAASAAPIVIAHRGASGYLPEHTLESAAFAHALGADYIEQDCVLSKDGIPVVLHDLVLDDVTNAAELFPGREQADGRFHAMDFTLEELRRLRVTERRSANRPWKSAGTRFPLEQGSFRIATLAEHLQLVQGLNRSRGREAGVYVEVKDPAKHRAAGLDAAAAIWGVLREYGYDSADDRVYVQCFDKLEVQRMRQELKCPLPLIWLTGKAPSEEELREVAKYSDGVGLLLTLVVTGVDAAGKPEISSLVTQAHQLGMPVHVWTWRSDSLPGFVKQGDELLEWLTVQAGVDGIFADQPDLVVDWRNQRLQQAGRGNPFRLLNSGLSGSGKPEKPQNPPK